MIENEIYQHVLNDGLTLDHYFLLCNIRDNIEPIKNKRIQGFWNLLVKKEYIVDNFLTEKALQLIENTKTAEIIIEKEEKVNLSEWFEKLHGKCQARIIKHTKRRQIRPKILGRTYSFMPNVQDLSKNLLKIITLYKIKDLDKIERTLIRYIDECAKESSWFPLLNYYIMKDGKSQLVTDMDNVDDESDETDDFEIVTPKDIV